MTVPNLKLAHLAFRWQGPRVVSGARRKGFVCGDCKRQNQRRNFHRTQPSRENNRDGVDTIDGKKAGKSRSSLSDLLTPEMQELDISVGDKDLTELRAKYDSLSREEQETYREEFSQRMFDRIVKGLPEDVQKEIAKDYREAEQAEVSPPELARLSSEMNREVQRAIVEYERDKPQIQQPKPKRRPRKTFSDYGEEANSPNMDTKRSYQGDDLNELGHAELEYHRELRQYARIAVWEMPLLSKLAKPFKPPDATEMLRFRYTTYMGEEHPAAKKIVLEFDPSDLPDLTEQQRNKLIKIAGPRYNPETNIIKMSSETFETQAQNKRYLGDLVDTLMAEAKDGTDTFEDVPFDFRHHKFKKRIEFPQNWIMTPERKAQLELERRAGEDKEAQRMLASNIVDGGKIHQMAMAALSVKDNGGLLAEPQRRGTKGGARPRMLR